MSDDVVFIDVETLENFMRDVFIGVGVPKDDADIIAEQYKIGMVLIGMSLIHNKSKAKDDKIEDAMEKDLPLDELINDVTKSVAPVLLPMINQLSDLKTIDD